MPIISYNVLPGDIAPKDMKFTSVEDEYKKNPDLKKEDIEELREWVKKQDHLPEISEKLLIFFHYSCLYKLEATKECINVYYNLRLSTPEFFCERTVSSSQAKKSLETLSYGVFPVKDPEGNQIIFHGLQQYEPSKYVFSEGVKYLTMAAEAVTMVEGTLPGFIFLFDMKGVRLGHLTRLSMTLVKKFFMYIQEGIPVRLKAIHVVNTLPIIDKVMFIIKPFLKKELLKLIHFHYGSDYSELHKCLPPQCLPRDFDGDLPFVEELQADFVDFMRKMEPYFEEDEKYRSTMSEKLKKTSKPSRETSFGGLEID